MTRQVRLTVNLDDVTGSSLHVLRGALLREIRRQARRYERNASRAGREVASREHVAAVALAREAGCSAVDIDEAMGL